jgi:hypothetical protein
VVPSLLTAGMSEEEAHSPGHFLDDDADRHGVGTCSAILLRHVDRREPALVERLVHVPGELTRLIDLRRPRRHLVDHEVAHRVAERLMLLAQREVTEIRITCHDTLL